MDELETRLEQSGYHPGTLHDGVEREILARVETLGIFVILVGTPRRPKYFFPRQPPTHH